VTIVGMDPRSRADQTSTAMYPSQAKGSAALSSARVPTPLPGQLRRPIVQTGPARGPARLRSIRVLWFLFRCMLMVIAHLTTGRLESHTASVRRGVAVRKEIEELGGLWIKAGQLLGLRRDIFPEEFCDELSRLQDLANGFDAASVRVLFDEEFGRQPEEMFAEFDLVPIAAGSVGQVHTAVTMRGRKVAVKLQRPEVDRVFQADLRYIHAIVSVLVSLNWMPQGRWNEMLWELQQMMMTELDYRFEAANIRRMRKTLRAHKVITPAVLSKFTTKRVLVMEYIEGVFMSDFIRASIADPPAVVAWCTDNDINPALVGWRLYQTHTRQVYEDNLFHSDLHPGNIVLLTGSRLALIDFGSIGSIDASKLRKYYMIFQAVAERDFDKVADLFLMLATGLLPADTEEVKSAIVHTMRTWETRTSVRELPYHEKSLTYSINEMARIFREHRIPISWEFMRVNRAEVTMDLSLQFLMPDADYYKLIQRYEKKAKRRALRRALDHGSMPDRILDLAVVGTMPRYAAENIQFDAEWIRKRGMNFKRTPGTGSFVTKKLVSLLAIVTPIIAGLLALAYSQSLASWWLGQKATELTDTLFPWLTDQGAIVWLLTIAGLLYISHLLRALRRQMDYAMEAI